MTAQMTAQMMAMIGPDDEAFLTLFPSDLRPLLCQHGVGNLQEVVMDLGGCVESRHTEGTDRFNDWVVTPDLLQSVIKTLSPFNRDNRAGIPRTLHRISAIRNRRGDIVGLTCRLGRAIMGTIDPLKECILSGKSMLFLGAPGSGKTTKLREAARWLATEHGKRVMVVDTSNEIAGEGDIPHPAMGFARRMQVADPLLQHAIMIEAVENHTPEVIVVDEIGTEAEAHAARTIAERGVQLIATAHGHGIESIIKNPLLSDLVGGVHSVVLGDDEAKIRGTQKSILERKSAPTFDRVVEIRDRHTMALYRDVARTVDGILAGERVMPEMLQFNTHSDPSLATKGPLKVWVAGLSTQHVTGALNGLNRPFDWASSLDEADVVIGLANQTKRMPRLNANGRSMVIIRVKSDQRGEIDNACRVALSPPSDQDQLEDDAIRDIERIIAQVKQTHRAMDAMPCAQALRRIQHDVVSTHDLNAISVGDEPSRRVRVFPPSVMP